ncbi:dTDP-4-dehydrorhamnose reductase [Pseudoxanthomonas sacheonensis]|uniref:dTDP-4-dehydrorhamnose reductase n=1 Tax=Pseudoxanthomonas sacheonensis TaxID=443615 RepID=UPI0013D32623|nr:dTDP-4-dehydrorhamnose reductase [Pseudoxanthomonas sacheonensis]KAF1713027.1 dTDP-4-dehydrorhamnose reductase [Pseudoxanthomonas sacheonensis]
MKILLLGANGQVGHELLRSLRPLGDIVATTRSGVLDDEECEIADFDQPDSLPALFSRVSPDVVVNAAAYTAVDRAESDPEAAFRANAEVPGKLAEACAASNALLVHYSTDYVFDGQGIRPYREDDLAAPLGVYGASKLAGERAIEASGCRRFIFRTAWVYGNHGANFMRTMLRLGADRDELRVVADQTGTPTPAALIADVTAQIIAMPSQAYGTFHLTAGGRTSWHGFATEIFEGARRHGLLASVPRISPITTAEYPTPAKRPAYSCLDTSALQNTFGIALPDWKLGLERVLAASSMQD